MTWEYRVVRYVRGGEETLEIHEVFYDVAGAIELWSPLSSSPGGETLEELVADLALMRAATDRPVLERAELPGLSEEDANSRW